MIGYLRGRVLSKTLSSLLLDVQGVGYEVEIAATTYEQLPEAGREAEIFTHLSVREDAHTLYGFSAESDRVLFRSLIKVNGVGAKMALGILSSMSARDFQFCVQNHDVTALVKIPGVGKKTAERLIIEMRDRLSDTLAEAPLMGDLLSGGMSKAPLSPIKEAESALVALGYKSQEAIHMLKAVAAEGLSAEQLIRQALQNSARS